MLLTRERADIKREINLDYLDIILIDIWNEGGVGFTVTFNFSFRIISIYFGYKYGLKFITAIVRGLLRVARTRTGRLGGHDLDILLGGAAFPESKQNFNVKYVKKTKAQSTAYLVSSDTDPPPIAMCSSPDECQAN